MFNNTLNTPYRDRMNQYNKKLQTLNKLPMLREKHIPELKVISEQARIEQVKEVELASWLESFLLIYY